ncbi:transcription antitermination factor NusB [Asticcacaulis sp. EMRT-3]|uniref:transcription antitermination factor NusB n=1 Tax=Asticcacaulis sp. EMRT-3 TaxID=3040349 RepID=UPI0024AF1AAF|nr:transcription antitermination factor NusB [Asticcacaulis sp. EMRT-3]MDI7774406.1 transcription antitermination factor NusB [Asticcacaulis sp. EMRT-3]
MSESTPPTSLKAVMEHLNAQAGVTPSLTKKDKRARTVARLVLVQALYQLELTGSGVEAVIREFSDYRFDGDIEGEPMGQADEAFFAEGARAVVREQATIDAAITARLAAGWRIERLDTTVRAILRAGTWEMMLRKDVALEVVINEYVEIARAFFGETEARFVNAALDGIAKDVR